MNDRDERRHPDREALHRHAEGELPGAAEAEMEAHLETCAACRREVEETRELLRRAAALPRRIEPPRDLWPGVEARVRAEPRGGSSGLAFPGVRGGEDAGPGHGRRGAAGSPAAGWRDAVPWLAAAAAALVAVTAGATLWLAGGSGGAPEPGAADVATAPAADTFTAGGGAGRLAGVERVEANYRPMVDRLTTVMESRGGRLPAETREVVERNLGIIDAAIAEAESALARHPASPELLRALDRSYQRKIDLLRRSARLTAQM